MLSEKQRDILFSDFSDDGKDIDFDRETIMKYSGVNFYTEKEMRERAKKAFSKTKD
jgi:hypothetical protein